MINVLRKNQKALWIVIALLCIPFVFYFSNTPSGAIGNDKLGQIYGRTVSIVEGQRNARLFSLARDLGMFPFLQDMVAGATTENEAYVEFTWNHLVLHHEAERLGIAPTAGEIATIVKNLRPFRGPTGFDINKYTQFVQTALPPMGFNEAQVEELAADQLKLERLKELLGAGVSIPEAESRDNYEKAYGKLNVAVARVRSEDLSKAVQISDEDVAKYYEAHKAELNSEEKRRVSFVTFGLDEEQKKLAGKERVETLQKLADRANDFNQALLEKGAQFDQVAAKFQAPIQVSGEIIRSKPDAFLTANPQLLEAIFQLGGQDSNSDAIQVGDSFYVLHLSGMEPAQPLSLEQAKSKIVETMKNQRVREMVTTKGAEAAAKVREALKAGTPLDAALQQTGLPTEKIPVFALMDAPAMKVEPGKPPEALAVAPDMQMIKGAVGEMSPGEVSEFIPTEAGGVVAVLEKREPPDAANYEKAKVSFITRVLKGKRDLAFYEWLRQRRREAGVTPAQQEQAPLEPDAG